jgi:hypothetical protein
VPIANEGEHRWRWWGQARDAGSAVAGFAILGVETYRATYNPIAMGVALACMGILASGVIGRWLLGRYDGTNAGGGK